MVCLETLQNLVPWESTTPQLLFEQGEHRIFWLGTGSATAFRCNTYLISSGDEALLVDPGGRDCFQEIRRRLAEIVDVEQLKGLIISHQDPDVAASMHQWLQLLPDLIVFTTPRANVLLPSYCNGEYRFFDVEEKNTFNLKGGKRIRFIPAPFLHFPGAFTTYDETSGFLFSGDIWAALDMGGPLVASSMVHHRAKMDLFMKDYMASNRAARGFVQRLNGLKIAAILPQHGSIIPGEMVPEAMDYLEHLECGLDLIYPVRLDTLQGTGAALGLWPEEPVQEQELGRIAAEFQDCQSRCPIRKQSPQRCNHIMRDALVQAMRLARMRDRAVRELKAVEQRLIESNTLLAQAQSLAHVGHWKMEIDGGEVSWSEEMFRIFGLNSATFEPTYERFLQACHPDDRYRVQLLIRQAVNDGRPYELIHKIVRPDGKTRTVQHRGQVTVDEKGEPVRLLGALLDITPLARAEEELLAQKELIEAIQRMQSTFLADPDPFTVCRQVLADIRSLTKSEHGFVGEVHQDPEGNPYMIVYALTDASWDHDSKMLYEQARAKGMEFHNLDNLFGRVITRARPIITNKPSRHPASRGTPPGHPELESFMGIPVMYRDRVVGMIGLANRPGGYNEEIFKYIQPFIVAFGQLIVAGQDQRARREAEEVLVRQAKLDGLLGIPNRRHLDEYLEQQLRASDRQASFLSVIMIDVDHFKLYNDKYGHQKGDWCLKQVAKTIQGALKRPMDMIGRYGGEEFCCILPNTAKEGAMEVAQRIREHLAREAIPHKSSPVAPYVTVSMGIATRSPGSRLTARELISMADHCLYEAKAIGRDSIVVASLDE